MRSLIADLMTSDREENSPALRPDPPAGEQFARPRDARIGRVVPPAVGGDVHAGGYVLQLGPAARSLHHERLLGVRHKQVESVVAGAAEVDGQDLASGRGPFAAARQKHQTAARGARGFLAADGGAVRHGREQAALADRQPRPGGPLVPAGQDPDL